MPHGEQLSIWFRLFKSAGFECPVGWTFPVIVVANDDTPVVIGAFPGGAVTEDVTKAVSVLTTVGGGGGGGVVVTTTGTVVVCVGVGVGWFVVVQVSPVLSQS